MAKAARSRASQDEISAASAERPAASPWAAIDAQFIKIPLSATHPQRPFNSTALQFGSIRSSEFHAEKCRVLSVQ